MSVVTISAACLAVLLVAAARLGRRPSAGRAVPVAALAPDVAGHCLLCNRPLPSHLVTRDEVIARVEARIDLDTAAVSQLLSSPPSPDWVGLFRP